MVRDIEQGHAAATLHLGVEDVEWRSKLSRPIEIADIDKVILGKKGFLFQKFDQAFEQLCGNRELRPDQISRWVGLIESRHAWCKARGVPYIFAVAPEKLAIYPDCLPDGFALNKNRPVIKIFDALSSPVRSSCLYYEDALRSARNFGETFYRTDIHWTQFGACVAYNEIAKISNGFLRQIDLASLKIVEASFTGEFSFHLKERISERTVFVEYTPPRRYKKVLSRSSFKEGQIEVYETEGADERTLIFFRDSNGTALLRYLLPHFSRAIVVGSARMFHELIRSEPCSLVITQMAERYLGRLDDSGSVTMFPEDFASKGFVESTGALLPLPTKQRTARDFDLDLRTGGNAETFLGTGWSAPEPNHRWAIGAQCVVNIPAWALAAPATIEFSVEPFVDNRSHLMQRAIIFLDDIKMDSITASSAQTVILTIPASLQGKAVTLKIATPDAIAPITLGVNEERRVLSFSFDHIRVRRMQ